jgi:hypothetical protein
MAPTVTQISWVLLAVGPDITKVLAVVALRKVSLICVELCLDDNMFKALQL